MSAEQREGHVWSAIAEPMVEVARRMEERPPVRFLATAIAGILAVGIAGVQGREAAASPDVIAIEVAANPLVADIVEAQPTPGEQKFPEPSPAATEVPAPPTPTEPSPPPVATEPAPPPPTQPQEQPLRASSNLRAERSAKSYEAIEAMQLTREGYVQVLSAIRTDFYDYAQSKEKFNPQIMEQRGIPQHATQFFTKHATAGYYNSDNTVTNQPVGDPSVQKFIDVIAGRGGGVCCAVNRYTDRNGEVYWLAPRQAKLRHNYGYDGVTTGDEIEAYLETDITTKQLEASAYVDIGNLIVEGLISQSLNDTIEGHAHTRTDYKAEHPESTIPAKIDWTEDYTAGYRVKIQEFIDANPDLKDLIPASFLALP